MDFTKSYLVAALIKKLKVLGAKLRPFNATHNANDSHKQLALPKPLKLKIVERYQPAYDFICRRYKKSMLNLWQGYQLL